MYISLQIEHCPFGRDGVARSERERPFPNMGSLAGLSKEKKTTRGYVKDGQMDEMRWFLVFALSSPSYPTPSPQTFTSISNLPPFPYLISSRGVDDGEDLLQRDQGFIDPLHFLPLLFPYFRRMETIERGRKQKWEGICSIYG
jgi:hypothetical protein